MALQIEKLELQSKANAPLLIAGPCSAENQPQILNTAKALCSMGIEIFRAGIWKPRTKPGCFEGVGNIGLEWLKEAKQQTGMLMCTEVATAEHVSMALEAGIDILWIGARTTTDPFAVEALAEAFRDFGNKQQPADVTLLIKNPVNPDVELWCGAIERFYNRGIRKIGLIHRGFSSYRTGRYRNIPLWDIPIEMKRRFPDITMICDPSHIGGNRNLVASISQQAMDMNYDGLMIECHIDPERALSDKAQQLSPVALKEMLQHLIVRDNHQPQDSLKIFRSRIDELDENLINILSERMVVAGKIGRYKEEHNMPVLQSLRYGELVERLKAKALELNLNEEFIQALMEIIHKESVRIQLDQRKNT